MSETVNTQITDLCNDILTSAHDWDTSGVSRADAIKSAAIQIRRLSNRIPDVRQAIRPRWDRLGL